MALACNLLGSCRYLWVYSNMLLKWREISNSDLEKAEKLEQLRLIDAGYEISTFVADEECLSVDTEEQLAIARSKVR